MPSADALVRSVVQPQRAVPHASSRARLERARPRAARAPARAAPRGPARAGSSGDHRRSPITASADARRAHRRRRGSSPPRAEPAERRPRSTTRPGCLGQQVAAKITPAISAASMIRPRGRRAETRRRARARAAARGGRSGRARARRRSPSRRAASEVVRPLRPGWKRRVRGRTAPTTKSSYQVGVEPAADVAAHALDLAGACACDLTSASALHREATVSHTTLQCKVMPAGPASVPRKRTTTSAPSAAEAAAATKQACQSSPRRARRRRPCRPRSRSGSRSPARRRPPSRRRGRDPPISWLPAAPSGAISRPGGQDQQRHRRDRAGEQRRQVAERQQEREPQVDRAERPGQRARRRRGRRRRSRPTRSRAARPASSALPCCSANAGRLISTAPKQKPTGSEANTTVRTPAERSAPSAPCEPRLACGPPRRATAGARRTAACRRASRRR